MNMYNLISHQTELNLGRPDLKKKLFFFSAWASTLNLGLINKGRYGTVCFVACGIWCLADVSSVSPSSEQTEGLWGNQCFKIVGNKFRRIEKLSFAVG